MPREPSLESITPNEKLNNNLLWEGQDVQTELDVIKQRLVRLLFGSIHIRTRRRAIVYERKGSTLYGQGIFYYCCVCW
jgi:hypothetical protein